MTASSYAEAMVKLALSLSSLSASDDDDDKHHSSLILIKLGRIVPRRDDDENEPCSLGTPRDGAKPFLEGAEGLGSGDNVLGGVRVVPSTIER